MRYKDADVMGSWHRSWRTLYQRWHLPSFCLAHRLILPPPSSFESGVGKNVPILPPALLYSRATVQLASPFLTYEEGNGPGLGIPHFQDCQLPCYQNPILLLALPLTAPQVLELQCNLLSSKVIRANLLTRGRQPRRRKIV